MEGIKKARKDGLPEDAANRLKPKWIRSLVSNEGGCPIHAKEKGDHDV